MPAFTYNPGSDGSGGYPQPGGDPRVTLVNPLGANGLAEFGGVRVHDGTYVLEALGGLVDTPEVRQEVTDRAQDHGAFLAGSFYGARTVTVEGYVMTDHLDQLWPAIDRLKQAFALPQQVEALPQLRVRLPGWDRIRFCRARPAGPLVIANRSGSSARAPYRDFQAVLIAPDPRLLDTAPKQASGTLGVDLSVTNGGNFPAHLIWEVLGPATNPRLNRFVGSTRYAIAYDGTVAAGETLRVDTNARTVTLNGGNVYRNVSRFDDLTIPPGTHTYTTSGGTGSANVVWSDTYI